MSSYVITVIGIPVYHHYCGGELEEINYVLKSNSCCDGEEDDSSSTNDCCKDENLILKSDVDFTLKNFHDYSLVKTFSEVFYISLPFSVSLPESSSLVAGNFNESPPPNLVQDVIVSTSVLRV